MRELNDIEINGVAGGFVTLHYIRLAAIHVAANTDWDAVRHGVSEGLDHVRESNARSNSL